MSLAEKTLEEMVIYLLARKPDDPIPYMLQFLEEKKGVANKALTSDERQELDSLRSEQKRLEEKLKQTGSVNDEESKRGGAADSASSDEVFQLFSNFFRVEMKVPSRLHKLTSIKPRTWLRKREPQYLQRFSVSTIKGIHSNRLSSRRTLRSSQSKAQGFFTIFRIRSRLLQSFMFMGLDDGDMEVVIDAMDEKKAKAGTNIIVEGENGGELYVVEEGQLDCFKKFPDAPEPKFLKTYVPGDAFGELALLYNAPRAATIKAKTDCHLWVLDRNTFNFIVKDAASRKREKYEEFLKSVSILSSMDLYERAKLSDAIKEEKFEPNDYVIREVLLFMI